MAEIRLHFTEGNHLNTLLEDNDFRDELNYLNPHKLDNNYIVLFDPVEQHSQLDTEVVVLSKFARAIKRIIYPTTNHIIEFLNPYIEEQKNGLVHNGEVIIDITVLE